MRSRRAFIGSVLAFGAGAEDWTRLTLAEAAERLRRRQCSPVELTRACLGRIEKLNPALNAFITVTAETALADARRLEAELIKGRSRGPLHGIPVALKDLYDTRGVRTTAGSAQYRNRVPEEDAEVVRRLKQAGAVLVGKLNMDEFAYNFTSETSYYGLSRNPWNRLRSPGGSSGGSAIAVAAGMCYAALGSDTGGSIRLPAALCGITGFKPTYGRVDARGVVPLAWSLDHVGPMTRSARDAALMMEVIGDPRPKAAPPAVKGLRLGVPRALFYEQLDPETASAVERAAKDLGRPREVALPPLDRSPQWPDLPLTYSRIIAAEAFAFHRDMLKARPGQYHPMTRANLEGGAAVAAADYILARREMDELRAGSGRLFAEADLLVTPAAPRPAFELGKPAGLVFLRNSAPWNLYGLPSISIPCGFTRGGLPVGLQITGPAGRDDLVLAAADAYQSITDWHRKRPPEPA